MTPAADRRRPSPEWLRHRWDQQRRTTADRVGRAVTRLRTQGHAITFAAIRDTVKALDGVSISTNTIQRNEAHMRSISSTRQLALPVNAGIDRSSRSSIAHLLTSAAAFARRLRACAARRRTSSSPR